MSEHFTRIAEQEGLPLGRPVEYDYGQYLHQVPGGMYSNLRHQLEKVGLGHKFHEALEECGPGAEEEFAYPIMVTPLSQFVGSQAAINVIVGERYAPGHRPEHPLRPGAVGARRAAGLMDPEVKGQDPRPAARPGAGEMGAARSRPSKRSARGFEPGLSDDDLLAALAGHPGGIQRHARRRPGDSVRRKRRARPVGEPARPQRPTTSTSRNPD